MPALMNNENSNAPTALRMAVMIISKVKSEKKKVFIQLLGIALLMLAGMTAYEVLKQILHPDITVWESHVITIVFSTACAVFASYFILRKVIEINNTLSTKVVECQRLGKGLEETIEQLKITLSEVKTLSGLLPICASCKRIRDDKGYWNLIETYIKEHSDAEFTHGLCPECTKALYPQLYKEDEES
jgi:hypothetical protein